MTRIGLISDTHGYFDPQIGELFRGVDLIFHAGDIGGTAIIDELERIAPVTAVLGNNDPGLPFRETEMVETSRGKFLLHHIVDPGKLSGPVRDLVARSKPDAVIFGHTHKPFHEQRGRVHYINPGYAGKPRFTLRRSVALLDWDNGEPRVTFQILK
jgi:uncharacterized protein